jgi:hypothetical protein
MNRRTWVIGGVLLVVLALAAVVVVARASSNSGAAATTSTTSPSTTAPPTSTTGAPAAVYPLTGLPVTTPGGETRPALVVKIDNADGSGAANNARPQMGLNQADVVYEEMVEGSVSRLAAIFQSMDPGQVGPVRSARSTDVAVFSALNKPLFAWSGANDTFFALIRSSPLIDVGFDAHPDVYTRQSGYVAPHNLFSDTGKLWGLAPGDASPPPALWPFRAYGQTLPPDAAPVVSFHIDWGGGAGNAPADWTWHADTGLFFRDQKGTPHVDAAGNQIAVPNVIVQNVQYVDTGIRDVVGTPVPEGQLVGSGTCSVLTAGSIVPCHWSKASADAVTVYTDDATNQPIPLTPGRTWVELAPIGGAHQTG